MKPFNHFPFWIVIFLACGLAACDKLGLDDPTKSSAFKEAEGKAIGGACRHAGRGLEDCFQQNPKAQKPAIFTGWKEMNDYMVQNKIDVIPPPPPPPPPAPPPPAANPDDDNKNDKAAKEEKQAAKH